MKKLSLLLLIACICISAAACTKAKITSEETSVPVSRFMGMKDDIFIIEYGSLPEHKYLEIFGCGLSDDINARSDKKLKVVAVSEEKAAELNDTAILRGKLADGFIVLYTQQDYGKLHSFMSLWQEYSELPEKERSRVLGGLIYKTEGKINAVAVTYKSKKDRKYKFPVLEILKSVYVDEIMDNLD